LKEDSYGSNEEDKKEDRKEYNDRVRVRERSDIKLEEVEREVLGRTLLLAFCLNFGFVY